MTEATNETSLIKSGTDLNAVGLYTAEKMDILLEEIRKKVELTVLPDVSTDKNRKEIIAFSYKITQTKTMIEKGCLKVTEKKREEVKTANQAKKTAVEFLTDLAKDTREPVTEWEHKESERKEKERLAEEKRISGIRDKISAITAIPVDCVGMNYVQIVEKLYELEDVLVNEDGYGEFTQAAWTAKEEAVGKMRSLRDAVQVQEEAKIKAEKERVELAEQEKERAAKQKIEDDERQKKLDEESAKLEEDRKKLAEDQAEIDKQKKEIAAEKGKEAEPPVPPKKVESLPESKADPKEEALNAMTMIVDEDCAVMVLDAIMNGDIDHVTFNGTVK